MYSRNKSVLFALVYSCDFSHAKIKQFLRLISHHHTIQCLVGLLFINHKVFSYLLVHFCLSLLFKSWVQWHSCIELFFCLNWKIIALQCCVCFCHKTTRISHKYIPTLLSLPPTAPIPPLEVITEAGWAPCVIWQNFLVSFNPVWIIMFSLIKPDLCYLSYRLKHL